MGAIGQPDVRAGEVPCAFVELVAGATVTADELMVFAADHVHERAAQPKYIEIMDELPKTAVGKIFKPDLRRSAITRVYNATLSEACIGASVIGVVEDKKRGLVAQLEKTEKSVSDDTVQGVLGGFITQWEWA